MVEGRPRRFQMKGLVKEGRYLRRIEGEERGTGLLMGQRKRGLPQVFFIFLAATVSLLLARRAGVTLVPMGG